MNLRQISLLGLAFSLLAAGCATQPGTEVNSWHDPQFTLSSTNTIALTDRPNLSPEDAALNRLLVAEMHRAGFTLVPANQADYLLSYVTDHITEVQPYMRSVPANPNALGNPMISTTPQSSREIIDQPYTPSMETSIQTFVFHSKEFALYVYTNPQTHPGRLTLIWQGTINAGQSVTEAQEQILIRTLLGYFGKVHGGRVELAHDGSPVN